MKKTFFSVGPSQIYPTVPLHIQNAIKDNILSISHRGTQFKDIYKQALERLRDLLKIPENYEIIFVSSALEAMERIIQSMSHNTTGHVLTGYFGKTWSGIARDINRTPLEFSYFDWNKNLISKIPLENLKLPKKVELVCLTQNDTSVGFSLPMSEIYKLRKKYPEKLFALDIVSSVPIVDIEYKYLDAVFFSVQKGFGLPAGLGVLILSPKAIKQAQKLSKLKNYSIGSYHNILKLAEKSREFQTNETPNVLGIYLLANVLRDFQKIGINRLKKQISDQAQMLYSFFSKPEYYSAFIKPEEFRSLTTPVFEIAKGSDQLIKFAGEKGLVLGAGYKDFKNKHVRIGNFPALTEKDFEKLIKVVKRFKNAGL